MDTLSGSSLARGGEEKRDGEAMCNLRFVWKSLSIFSITACFSLAAAASHHCADTNPDYFIDLSELLRVIQFYNSDGLHCQAGSEDGYDPGPGDRTCKAHDSDYNPQDWHIDLSELLRIIQFL
ncbi:MAG: hypothetical protein RBT80_28005 [Candidatus Vecturithrix sp.]|jgi:hypothetical protein|nr:hypothetical protein [Candidatus Vecturithrix sp.]